MKQKILYVAGISGFMEPTNGGQIRAHEILKKLCAEYEVDIFSPFLPNRLQNSDIQIARNICPATLSRLYRWRRRRGFSRLINILLQRVAATTQHHLQNGHLYERKILERLIQANHEDYQYIFYDTSLYAPLSPSLEVRGKSLLIAHNVDSVLQPNSIFHTRFEAYLDKLFQMVIACTEQDADRFRCTSPDVRCVVWPNGTTLPTTATTNEFVYDVLFVGALNFKPNIEAAHFLVEKVWPQIRKKGITMCIAGRSPSSELTNKLSSAGIHFIPDAPDLSAIYDRSKVAVVPLITGSGSRLKIAEALIHGLPVVSTALGAEGYPENHKGLTRQECFPVEEFIRAIEDAMRSQKPEERQRIAIAATPFLWNNTIDLSMLP